MLITQGLDDHAHARTLEALARAGYTAPIIAPPSARALLEEYFPPTQITTLISEGLGTPWHTVEITERVDSQVRAGDRFTFDSDLIGGATVDVRPTRGARVGPPWSERQNGYVLRTAAFSVYLEPHVEYDSAELASLSPVDAVITPIVGQALGAMELVHGPKQVVELLRVLRPRYVLPMANGEIDSRGLAAGMISKVGGVNEVEDALPPGAELISVAIGRPVHLHRIPDGWSQDVWEGWDASDGSGRNGTGAVARFLEAWQERVNPWWKGTAARDGLDACMAAFGLVLAERLERILRAARAALGEGPTLGPAGGGGGASAAGGAGRADRCSWVSERIEDSTLELPQFPELDAFDGGKLLRWLPPIPKLLPKGEWTRAAIEAEAELTLTPVDRASSEAVDASVEAPLTGGSVHAVSMPAGVALAAGAVAGGAAALVAVGCAALLGRSRRGRIRARGIRAVVPPS